MISKIAQIKISTPCSEDWQGMIPNDGGKHCAKCDHKVVDFTGMSDNGIVDYLRKNKQTCGRFYEHQLERDFMLVPEKPVWKMRFSGLATGILLFSQLWAKRMEAKTEDKSVIVNNVHAQASIADTIEIRRSFKGSVNQPDSAFDKARKLVFHIDDFRMEVFCDLLKSTEFNFQIPDSLKSETITVELFTMDSVFNFDILPSIDFQNRQMNNFYFNNGWHQMTLNEVPPYNLEISTVWGPVVTMGIPMQLPIIPQPITLRCESVLSGMVTIDSSVINQAQIEERKLNQQVKLNQQLRLAGVKKQNNWSWWWLVFVFTLSAAIRWFFNGFKNKVSQNPE